MSWVKKEPVAPVKEEIVKPTVIKIPVQKDEVKMKTFVVKELPVKRIRFLHASDEEELNLMKQFTEEEVSLIKFITIEEALTEMYE